MCNKKVTFRFSSGNTRGMANEGYLPREIWADILTRLPAKVVGQCKCICKHWCSVIEDPSFVELHHFRAKSRAGGCHLVISSGDCDFENTSFFSADYGGGLAQHLFRCSISDSSDMEAPVNGLICGYNRGAKSIFIVNPITKEVISLPPFSLPSFSYSGGYFHSPPLVAFGFDPSTKQYKVLHIDRLKKEDTHGNLEFFHCECEVFTLGTQSWRKIDVIPPASQFEFGGNGICLGGVIHWRNFSTGESSRPVDEVVVAFDLKDEIFRVISLPRGPSRMPLLVEVGGHLAACQEYPESENEP